MDTHAPDGGPASVIAQAYLEALELFTSTPPAAPLPQHTASGLHGELTSVIRSLRPLMGTLASALAALADGAPTDPAAVVAAEAILQVHLAWLRLVHHSEIILSGQPGPEARRVALLAQALAPAARVTAEHASDALVLCARA